MDWRRRVVQVEPPAEQGRARWIGEGRPLSFELCQGIRRVLDGVTLSRRAEGRLEAARTEFAWVRPEEETVVLRSPDGEFAWWTFAGPNANTWLTVALGDLVDQVRPDDLRIRLVPTCGPRQGGRRLHAIEPEELALGEKVAEESINRLKFAGSLPEHLARRVVEVRLRDDEASGAVTGWRVRAHQASV